MLQELLSDLPILSEKPFVLVDIGASGSPPAIWQAIAPWSDYIGFDPDARELNETNTYGFHSFRMVRQIVSDDFSDRVKFFLTIYPYCSSMLQPDMALCSQYSFADTFEVIDQAEFPATRLDTVMRELGLEAMHWLKLDSQGKDLDLYLSIDARFRRRLLAIDIEPGVMPFYQGENTFAETHTALLKEGFWLSSIQMQNGGFPRIQQSTRQALAHYQLPGAEAIAFEKLPVSPTAFEGRYLRTLEHLSVIGADLHDYVSLWVFALADNKLGFALDVALAIKERYPTEAIGERLLQKTLGQVAAYQQSR